VTLLLSRELDARAACRVFGATITSASGASFAKGCVADAPGDNDVTIILAVDVGERCNVIGCDCPAAGLGRARTCEMKFISRKRAWSSMTVFRQQSVH
jgi:hypothetical protein